MARSIDTRLDFLSPISTIPGLGPKRVPALAESGIATIGDMLYHFPRRYIDRSTITPISHCKDFIGQTVTIIATISKTRLERGRRQRLRIQLTDESGSMEALWFAGIAFFRASLQSGLRVLCTGTVALGPGLQFVHPNIEKLPEGKTLPDVAFLPVYPLTTAMKDAGIHQKLLYKSIVWILDNVKHYPQSLPRSIEEKYSFPPLDMCLRKLHLPDSPNSLDPIRSRLVYEELYKLALTLRFCKKNFRLPGRSMNPGKLADALTNLLPYTLTTDQQTAIQTLHSDAESPLRMHRLLQGDVGSGKTIVAFFACLPALNQGMQVAWLAPTEILAQQTFAALSPYLAKLDISYNILTGQSDKDQRKNILIDYAKGTLRFLVGTHALLEPTVACKKLGMVVIDEQHKFGAEQRLSLSQKDPAADFLVMSATPIPQTLAQTLYGDLDIISIRSMPKGRQPVSTHYVPTTKRHDMEQFILKHIDEHASQVYYVAPRIEANETINDEGLPIINNAEVKNVQTIANSLRQGIFSHLQIGMIHGQQDAKVTQDTMNRFIKGDIKILVSTTIIEVGIDVPAATILVIESSERFGLAQLHQLRGRVGRSDKKSYCFLLATLSQNTIAQERISYLCKHTDGFDIAEKDLLLRGPGEIAGYRQSGWDNLVMADILRDADIYRKIQADLDELTKL